MKEIGCQSVLLRQQYSNDMISPTATAQSQCARLRVERSRAAISIRSSFRRCPTWRDFSSWVLGTFIFVLSSRLAVAQFPLPDEFDPRADSSVFSVAVQPDGRILVGGSFTSLAGQTRSRIGLLNADGTLDNGFATEVEGDWVYALAVQADGKCLVGGEFWTLVGQPRNRIGRLNADGTLDSGFNPGADNVVNSLAVQSDDKIVVGGWFETLGGQPRTNIARLNPDGTLDSQFIGSSYLLDGLALQADGKILVRDYYYSHYLRRLNIEGTRDTNFSLYLNDPVNALVVQPDGKIVIGGEFTSPRGYIARLNPDGTLDSTFDPPLAGWVYSLALQADGKILVGGWIGILPGLTHKYICRLNPDGTVDEGFNPDADSVVSLLAVQADGKTLVGGGFTRLGGQERHFLARLNKTDPATQTLDYDGSAITWLRGGTSPEVWRTTFEHSMNGVTWAVLGAGTRISGGWRLGAVSPPSAGAIRARGYVTSGWFVETVLRTFSQTAPAIDTSDDRFGIRSDAFGFNLCGVDGQILVVEGSADMVQWKPLATNGLVNGVFCFTDPTWARSPCRFYRARLWP
jgi:uncharacterized delta-60 repeat protein